MNPNEYNRDVLGGLRASVQEFIVGELDLEEIQSALQSASGLLENDGSEVVEAVRLAEADVEEIRFTRLFEEQRSAVVFRLDQLVRRLPGERNG
jgi:hypothetical protein